MCVKVYWCTELYDDRGGVDLASLVTPLHRGGIPQSRLALAQKNGWRAWLIGA